MVLVDGQQHHDRAHKILQHYPEVDAFYLPYSAGNWGGRVYAAGSHLSRGEYIGYLDDDDFLEPEHVESLLSVIGEKSWSFCFRNLMMNGMFLARDQCDSLGTLHPTWHEKQNGRDIYQLGTGSCLLARKAALELSRFWAPTGFGDSLFQNDRQFFRELRARYPDGVCTYKYTMNYDLALHQFSYYVDGNKQMMQWHGVKLPWEAHA
jgi:glycosyltransferase involved in cell wall biosynthesis